MLSKQTTDCDWRAASSRQQKAIADQRPAQLVADWSIGQRACAGASHRKTSSSNQIDSSHVVTSMAATATDLQFEDLKILLQASDKETVITICNDLMQPLACQIGNTQALSIAKTLNIEKEQSAKLHTALSRLLKKALFLDTQDAEILLGLFPANFHSNLKELLVKIILDNQPKWRKQAISNQVSMPRLVDFDWRVDLKAASGTISRLSVPTCLVQFKVQNIPQKVGVVPDVDLTNMELSKETLDTMLNGLYKIQDQLSSIANQG